MSRRKTSTLTTSMGSSPSGYANRNMSSEFQQFDSAADDGSSHKFFVSNQSTIAWGTPLHKIIMKEWKILQENLPPTIYVRVYEKKIDCLRAAIVGPAGTPYHDCLFFFDVAFPSDYPNSPPKVHYHSFGFYINPNLYPEGTVCLSLLNTWFGSANERWFPGKSTMLQLLVSIQGLVLNEKPYYNEPYNIIGNRWRWRKYNETVFVKSCKIMLCLMRNPPKGFESFVREHFRNRGRDILTSCQAYYNGFLRVGEYRNSETFLEDRVKVRESFQLSLDSEYKRLEYEFRKSDPSIDGFLVQLNEAVEKKRKEYEEKNRRKRENGILGRIRRMIAAIADLVIGSVESRSGVRQTQSGVRQTQ